MENDDKQWFFRGYHIPEYMRQAIKLYVENGIRPGDFLSAVICNDLKSAYLYADDTNFHNVPAYVNYFYNYAPGPCWGSKEKMNQWMERKSAQNRA